MSTATLSPTGIKAQAIHKALTKAMAKSTKTGYAMQIVGFALGAQSSQALRQLFAQQTVANSKLALVILDFLDTLADENNIVEMLSDEVWDNRAKLRQIATEIINEHGTDEDRAELAQ